VQARVPRITIIGHSQGALIAHRRSRNPHFAPSGHISDVRLITISGPFGGIAAAKTCGRSWLYPLTLGLLPLSCYAVTGAKWRDIAYLSKFIRKPGVLIPQVSQYLKIDTDERGTCRRHEDGRCVECDEVFSLGEQRNLVVECD
jgi:hypothetical protein